MFPGHVFNRFGGPDLDAWGASKPSIWCGMGCKIQFFTEVGILLILGSNFNVLALGLICMSFNALG